MATWKKVLLEGASSIGDLSDVTLTSAADAQILVHDGTDFDNVDVSGDVTITNAGAVTIANDAVITAKILDANVTLAKLAADSVDGTKIADDAVDSEHIADDAVLTAAILNGNVTLAKIANIGDATVLGNASGSAAAPSALTIDNDLSSVSVNDDTLASAKAIKSYVDTQVAAGYDLDISADTGDDEIILNNETLNLAGTSNQISTTTGTNSVTFSIPTGFTAPGSVTSTTTITAGTGLTVTSGGATITAGGATITAGGLDVNGGAVTLGTDGTTVEGGGLTVTAGGATVTAGGLTVSAGGADITGDTTVTGNLTVTGTTTTLQTENVLIEDKFLVLGNPDTAYASDAAAVTGATGGGISVLSDTDGSEGSYAAVMWNNNYLTGWEVGDTASVSEDGSKHPIAIMDFVVNSAAAPTVDSAGVGSFFFAQANSSSDGALYVRVQ